MAARTGVLMALFTTDWSRATNLVPTGKSSITGLSASALAAILAPTLAGLLCTLRTNTNEGLRRSSDADCTDEVAPSASVCVAGSEKSIFPRAYGPTFLVTGAVENVECAPIDGWVGRAVLPTSSGVTPWLPGASGCPVCAFSRGVTDPVWSVACWPGVTLRPKSGAPTRLASVDFLAVLEEENTPRNTRSTTMAAPASRKSERLRSRPSSRRFVTWYSRRALSKAWRKISRHPGREETFASSTNGSSAGPVSGAPVVFFSFSAAMLVLPRGAHPEPNWCQCGAVHSPRLRHLQQKHLVRLLVWRTIKHYDTVGAFGRSQPAPAQPKVQHL